MKKVIVLAIIAFCLSASAFAQHKPMEKSHHEMTDTMYTCKMHPAVMSTKAGKCPECGMSLVKAKNTYSCPMHPDMMRSTPGKCPTCGMKMKKANQKSMKM